VRDTTSPSAQAVPHPLRRSHDHHDGVVVLCPARLNLPVPRRRPPLSVNHPLLVSRRQAHAVPQRAQTPLQAVASGSTSRGRCLARLAATWRSHPRHPTATGHDREPSLGQGTDYVRGNGLVRGCGTEGARRGGGHASSRDSLESAEKSRNRPKEEQLPGNSPPSPGQHDDHVVE
jgi:hypothetical protein